MPKRFSVRKTYRPSNHLTLWHGDCLRFLKTLPDQSVQLVLTSPPYNVGKEYEQQQTFEEYIAFQRLVIKECTRITKPGGSICWQLGNHIDSHGNLIPLDAALYSVFNDERELHLRNRIIWHFGHGLHCSTRFSGRYETVMWYTKGKEYVFNLDNVRVPQKYPGKLAYRGPRRGKPTGNPKGKNPGDVWQIPNVKGNHVEKTSHPCQFPIALAETIVLALTNRRHLIVDPFLGAGTTLVAALKNGRRGAGAEIKKRYIGIIRSRISSLENGELAYRPRMRPIYEPLPNTKLTTPPNGFATVSGYAFEDCKNGKATHSRKTVL